MAERRRDEPDAAEEWRDKPVEAEGDKDIKEGGLGGARKRQERKEKERKEGG
jgi:hypothetical protein